ncbi:MAG: hypothetical protein K2Z81_16080, partial [Cyanobacteria bacterium]|nr:hypothetical protein [Cyanobacteriota bacterium]
MDWRYDESGNESAAIATDAAELDCTSGSIVLADLEDSEREPRRAILPLDSADVPFVTIPEVFTCIHQGDQQKSTVAMYPGDDALIIFPEIKTNFHGRASHVTARDETTEGELVIDFDEMNHHLRDCVPLDSPKDDEKEIDGEDGEDATDDRRETEVRFVVDDGKLLGAPDKPGIVVGSDGSRVEFSSAADGKIRPIRTTHGDGTVTEFTWNKTGTLEKAVTKASDGRILCAVTRSDGGINYTIGDGNWTHKIKDGQLTVEANGTFQLKGESHEWRSQSKGGITGEFRQSAKKFLCQIDDGSVVLSCKEKGEYLPFQTRLKDSTEIIVSHTNGKPEYVLEKKGDSITEYQRNGDLWTKKTVCSGTEEKSSVGTLTLKRGLLPEFRENVESIKIERTRETPEKLRSSYALATLNKLDLMFDTVWSDAADRLESEVTNKLLLAEMA